MSASKRIAKPAATLRRSAKEPVAWQPQSEAWQAVPPKTRVDHAVDAILSAAARGLILPGDRLIEPDLAAHLGMSRVPIREALRILESQGVVTSEPYKGIRLMEVSPERLHQIIDVRISLESLACRRAIELGRNRQPQLAELDEAIDELTLMRQRRDTYGFAAADTAFHRRLCSFADNGVLSAVWESIARRLTVIIGLSTMGKPMAEIVTEHRRLADVFASGDIAAMEREIEDHLRVQVLDVDYQQVIAERRAALAKR